MRKIFNDGWEFAKTLPEENIKPEEYVPVELPHDWLISNTADLYESSFGHYRKLYDFGRVEGRSIRLYFEGVYMDSTIYLDGRKIMDWKYGYSSFEADLTPYLSDGEHLIEVLVRHISPNSRWYSGAGIFRDVWLIDSECSYLVTDGVYFHAEPEKGDDTGSWRCDISAEIFNASDCSVTAELTDEGRTLFSGMLKPVSAEDNGVPEASLVKCTAILKDIRPDELWDIDNPHLITLTIRLTDENGEKDSYTARVGLKHAVFDPDHGFILNGRHIKINGVCLHHDLGCLGAAFNMSAAKRQLCSMKEMGANAVRTSHNMPAPGFMQLCDEMGILVDSEAFDMWENPKTEYDYARFFPEWMERDVASWIRRDRNHPSVIMWSVGNEITDTNAIPRGREIAGALHRAVRKNDPLGNAPTTIGSNYMEWEGAQGCAEEMDLAGYNYLERLYEKHHKEHPAWKIYGSETTSCPKSRGVYHFPADTVVVTHEDGQCSSLGNSRNGVDADTTEKVICMNRDIECCAGMFIWTGSDYIGEPTPYSTKNSYYGNIDTAGLRKDTFYLYQSAWTEKPVLHLMPYWDYNPGQLIDVIAFTNLKKVELFLNGRSLGIREPREYTVSWQVPYEEGELLVRGTSSSGEEFTDVRRSFKDSAAIVLKPDTRGYVTDLYPVEGGTCLYDDSIYRAEEAGRGNVVIPGDESRSNVISVDESGSNVIPADVGNAVLIPADGVSVLAVEISTVDKDGNPVENARDRIHISVRGGRLLGFDNGDSTDYDSYKADERRLFSGKAVVMVMPDPSGAAEGMTVRATGAGLIPAEMKIDIVKTVKLREDIHISGKNCKTDQKAGISAEENMDIPVRKITLTGNTAGLITPKEPVPVLRSGILPEQATWKDIRWNVVTESGIPSPAAAVKIRENGDAELVVRGDGSFRVQCTAGNGSDFPQVISELEYKTEGFGRPKLDPRKYIRAALYTDSEGVMNLVREGGVGITPERRMVGFESVDFGEIGADKLTVRLITWFKDTAVPFSLWLGKPGSEGACCLGEFEHQAEFTWQTYKENHYELSEKIYGLQDVYFLFAATDLRVDFGGFCFR